MLNTIHSNWDHITQWVKGLSSREFSDYSMGISFLFIGLTLGLWSIVSIFKPPVKHTHYHDT